MASSRPPSEEYKGVAKESSTSSIKSRILLPKMRSAILDEAASLGFVETDYINIVRDNAYNGSDYWGYSFTSDDYSTIAQPKRPAWDLLASYYKRKYGIEIIIIDGEISGQSERLCRQIEEIRKRKADPIKCGFVYPISDDEGQHLVALVYEKNGDKEYLYDLDSKGSLGKLVYRDPFFQHFQIYLLRRGIQADNHSCYNQCFFLLKEALRLDSLSKSFRNVLQKNHYFICDWPERMLKTSQSSSVISETKANLQAPVKSNGTTLEQHRAHFGKALELKSKTGEVAQKVVNVYSLMNGWKNRERIATEFVYQCKLRPNI